jgi:voltage-gated potassium channel
MPKFYQIMGVAGVDSNERHSAYLTETIAQWIMIVIIFWLLLQNYLIENDYISLEQVEVIRWFIWLFFVTETITVTALCRRSLHYLAGNWLNLFIIIIAFPILWEHGTAVSILRIARVIIILYLLLPLGRRSDKALSATRFGVILILFVIITLMAGLFIAYIDPDIDGPWNGIWWAFQTVTTVGYGDILPQTLGGRIFSILFMLVGVGLLATLSASFAYFLLNRRGNIQKSEAKETQILNEIKVMQQAIEELKKNTEKKE